MLARLCGYPVAFGAMRIFNVEGIVEAGALGRAKREVWQAAPARGDQGRTAMEK